MDLSLTIKGIEMIRTQLFFITILVVMFSINTMAQNAESKKQGISMSGTAGISYEYYGLSRKPTGWTGFSPRKPWNQVRFNFTPEM